MRRYRNRYNRFGLYRSRNNAWFLGVCGGIADRFSFNAWGVRLLFIALTLFITKWTVLIYLALAFLLRPEPADHAFDRVFHRWSRRQGRC